MAGAGATDYGWLDLLGGSLGRRGGWFFGHAGVRGSWDREKESQDSWMWARELDFAGLTSETLA